MTVLYRGSKEPIALGRHRNPYLDLARRPRDTNLEVHKIADAWFLKRFAIAARSRTIMCTTNVLQANGYGPHVRIIRPEHPFHLIYSAEVDDFLAIQWAHLHPGDKPDVEGWLERHHYTCVNDLNDLSDGFSGEVMVSCDYYMVLEAPGYPVKH